MAKSPRWYYDHAMAVHAEEDDLNAMLPEGYTLVDVQDHTKKPDALFYVIEDEDGNTFTGDKWQNLLSRVWFNSLGYPNPWTEHEAQRKGRDS